MFLYYCHHASAFERLNQTRGHVCLLQCKLLDGEGSQYEPSKRSDAWLKLKRDYVEDLHDTLDLVPIGGW